MPPIYVDTSHYIALLIVDDSLHEHAISVAASLRDDTFVTSDPVLVELLAFVSALGEHYRSGAVELIRRLREHPNVEIIPQTRESFDKGLDLYDKRRDKAYSHTDCMSMVICAERDILSVLTHDHHFAQEGFEVLL